MTARTLPPLLKMASIAARAATGLTAPRAARVSSARPTLSVNRAALRKAAAAPSSSPARGVATAAGVEIAQVAGEAGFIAGTAFTMIGITLLGLAVGFVLLRVEAAVEE
uniref:Cytochrome b6-f complex subunit PetM n=1 Tax=Chlamydomonas euryale TaxID=1486919 RepID=A0A7R9YVC4_9CHLO